MDNVVIMFGTIIRDSKKKKPEKLKYVIFHLFSGEKLITHKIGS